MTKPPKPAVPKKGRGPRLTATKEVASVVAGHVKGLTAEQVQAVLDTYNTVQEGDPVGTVRRNEAGHVAVRCEVDGLHMWKVTLPDGGQYNDMTALGWPVIAEPVEPLDEAVVEGVEA